MSTSSFYIGENGAGTGCRGIIDEVCIWSAVLSYSQTNHIQLSARRATFVLCILQSNCVVGEQSSDEQSNANVHYKRRDNGDYQRLLYHHNGWTTGWHPRAGNVITAVTGRPVCFIDTAVSGTPIYGTAGDRWVYRNSADPDDPTTLYGTALGMLLQANAEDVVVVGVGGETDAYNGNSEVNVAQSLNTIHNNLENDAGLSMIFILNITGTLADGTTIDNLSNVRRGIARACSNNSRRILGGNAIDIARTDNWHYSGAGKHILGERIGNAILFALGQRNTWGYPRIIKNGVNLRAQIFNGTGITPASGLTGIESYVNSTWVPPSAAVVSGLNINLTHSGTPTDHRYMWNAAAPNVASIVRDNSSLTLPALPLAFDEVVISGASLSGSTITINGSGFQSAQETGYVLIAGFTVAITSWSNTQVVGTIHPSTPRGNQLLEVFNYYGVGDSGDVQVASPTGSRKSSYKSAYRSAFKPAFK